MSRRCYLSTMDLYRLELACRPLHKLIGDAIGGVYLVGSTWTTAAYRDVDVRMILEDPRFDALFPEPDQWSVFCYAVSRWLAADTGLPVDFQVQRMTEANERFGDKPRNPLGHGHRSFAGLGDATPYLVQPKPGGEQQ
ncbi:MAG TPA: hypothetical protein VFH56_14630 [Acidimicrobiales bacterium]|nr:hypothetical protein [Acidimicrobiales bacterium]